MSTKFLFPDWENEDDDSQDLCGRMREMAEEAARRERQGLPEKKERSISVIMLEKITMRKSKKKIQCIRLEVHW